MKQVVGERPLPPVGIGSDGLNMGVYTLADLLKLAMTGDNGRIESHHKNEEGTAGTHGSNISQKDSLPIDTASTRSSPDNVRDF